jgi:hypothetical protein
VGTQAIHVAHPLLAVHSNEQSMHGVYAAKMLDGCCWILAIPSTHKSLIDQPFLGLMLGYIYGNVLSPNIVAVDLLVSHAVSTTTM